MFALLHFYLLLLCLFPFLLRFHKCLQQKATELKTLFPFLDCLFSSFSYFIIQAISKVKVIVFACVRVRVCVPVSYVCVSVLSPFVTTSNVTKLVLNCDIFNERFNVLKLSICCTKFTANTQS